MHEADELERLRRDAEWSVPRLVERIGGWRAHGADDRRVRDALWSAVRPADSLDHVAFAAYALDASGIELPLDALRSRIAERDGVGAPPALDFATCVAPDRGEVTFTMGSPLDEEGRFEWEHGPHDVSLAPFELARTPVTEAQFAVLRPGSPASLLPVVDVSWWEAWLFARWVGGRLPTEAQWEFACRAGTRTRYWCGDDEGALDRAGWYLGNSGDRRREVAGKEANPLGLHDTHGNVFEWCRDWFGGSELPVRPATGERIVRDGPGRALRGGCYDGKARLSRSAMRYGFEASERRAFVGFRPAR